MFLALSGLDITGMPGEWDEPLSVEEDVSCIWLLDVGTVGLAWRELG